MESLRRQEVYLLSQKGRKQFRGGHLQEAEASFRMVLEIDPLNRTALTGLGDIFLAGRDYRAAVKVLEDVAAVHPSDDRLLYSLAGAYRGLQRRDKAFKTLQRLVEVNPGHIQGLTRLGDAFLERKNFEGAVVVYRRALELESDNLFALRGLGLSRQENAPRGYRGLGEAAPPYTPGSPRSPASR